MKKVFYEYKENWSYSQDKCYNTKCINFHDTTKHQVDNNCQHTSNTGKCKNFKTKEEKDMKKWDFYVEEDGKKYGFNKFTLADIYVKDPCKGEFMKLLIEMGD